MAKIPAFQFYPADWRKDPGVQALSYHDRGVWFEILCLMHESSERGRLILNGKPMPDAALARLLGLDKQNLTETLATLLDFGVASRGEDGALESRRMMRDENLRKTRANCGKLGGNPALLNQIANQTGKPMVNQIPTPSSSSSTSSSDKSKRGETPRGGPAAKVQKPKTEPEDPVERRIWRDGIDLLERSDVSKSQARPLLGRLAKEYGRITLAEAIAVTQAENPADPKAFMIGVLRERSAKPNGYKPDRVGAAAQVEHPPMPPPGCGKCRDTGWIDQYPDEPHVMHPDRMRKCGECGEAKNDDQTPRLS